MSLNADAANLFEGFSKLSREERFLRLIDMGALTPEDTTYLSAGGIKEMNLAEKWIENVIGYFQLPLGVATNFCIDGQDYVIPMAVEETSIIAALSKTAKWIRTHGKITTKVHGDCIIGQIQLTQVNDFRNFFKVIEQNKLFLIEQANDEVAHSMVRRGGGVKDLEVRKVQKPDGSYMAVIHLLMDTQDAMGANILNQVLEYLKSPIEQLTGEVVTMCILTNLNDRKLTTARIEISDIEPALGEKLQEASWFAESCPYRAATHNKGVMNGIDAVTLATGNDWRAIEAGVHAYAARNGRYQAISQWRYAEGVLVGELTAPLIVGTVGGVTALHPTAKMCVKMMGITCANHLSRILAAVGLVQNLGAIRALCTEGIIQGHMKLHIDNLSMVAGAREDEIPLLRVKMQECLKTLKRVTLSHAHTFLDEIRASQVIS